MARTGAMREAQSHLAKDQQQPRGAAGGAARSPDQRLCHSRLWPPGFQHLLFWGLLEMEEAQQLIPFPDLSSINLS